MDYTVVPLSCYLPFGSTCTRHEAADYFMLTRRVPGRLTKSFWVICLNPAKARGVVRVASRKV